MTVEDAIKFQLCNSTTFTLKSKLQELAFTLRKEIMDTESHKLPDNLTVDNIEKEEINEPDILHEFLQNVTCGPDYKRSSIKDMRINLIGQDVVFAATAGRKRPKKHIQLGLTLKSLTGSSRRIELLKRMGHCINYHGVTEIETEMTFEARDRSMCIPFGMDLLSCGLPMFSRVTSLVLALIAQSSPSTSFRSG